MVLFFVYFTYNDFVEMMKRLADNRSTSYNLLLAAPDNVRQAFLDDYFCKGPREISIERVEAVWKIVQTVALPMSTTKKRPLFIDDTEQLEALQSLKLLLERTVNGDDGV